jgi:hypothetical protein
MEWQPLHDALHLHSVRFTGCASINQFLLATFDATL